MTSERKLVEILRDDKNVISYRPRLNALTGSVTATILLQQMIHRYKGEAFYKFMEPCSHPRYREGDSWCEELGFTRSEFIRARDKIATKIRRGVSKKEAFDNSFVIYWTDSNRMTFYEVNEELLDNALSGLY